MRRFFAAAVLSFGLTSVLGGVSLADTATSATTDKANKGEIKLGPNEVAIFVGDMHCNNCAKKIAARLYRVKGVVKVRTTVKEGLAVITPQAKKQIDAKAAWGAVSKAGFEPTKMITPQGTFVADEKTKEPQKVADSENRESEQPAQS